ncbi:MAG TPA: RusA family crossover junction endodeoxyribonuclease [Phycisphaerae bacterium]|nr:RusA family crossover junction endodeoxyribonuclease [Phycisphaerae bacterium]
MSARRLSLFIPGLPVAKGSARAFMVGRKGPDGKVDPRHARPVVVQTNAKRQKGWASEISAAVQRELGQSHEGIVFITRMEFVMPRPNSHFRSNRKPLKDGSVWLRDDAPYYHAQDPDLDKLARLVLDALSAGVAYNNDNVVVAAYALTKRYEMPYDRSTGLYLDVELAEQPRIAELCWKPSKEALLPAC